MQLFILFYLAIDIPKGRRRKQTFVCDLNKCLALLFTKTSLTQCQSVRLITDKNNSSSRNCLLSVHASQTNTHTDGDTETRTKYLSICITVYFSLAKYTPHSSLSTDLMTGRDTGWRGYCTRGPRR